MDQLNGIPGVPVNILPFSFLFKSSKGLVG